MNVRRRMVVIGVAFGMWVCGCSANRATSPTLANDAYLHADGLKLILRFRQLSGRWPKSSAELTGAGILPTTLSGDPELKAPVAVSDKNFTIKVATDQDGLATIKFSINGLDYSDKNTIEALNYLR